VKALSGLASKTVFELQKSRPRPAMENMLKEGDWVQTNRQEVGKITSIDCERGTASIVTLDAERLRTVNVTYRIDHLNKFEIER
jgi:hypothetical protein